MKRSTTNHSSSSRNEKRLRTSKDIFDRYLIGFVAGSDVTQTRLSLLSKKIAENGGKVVDWLKQDKNSAAALLCTSTDSETKQAILILPRDFVQVRPVKLNKDIRRLLEYQKVDWIVESLKFKREISLAEYRISVEEVILWLNGNNSKPSNNGNDGTSVWAFTETASQFAKPPFPNLFPSSQESIYQRSASLVAPGDSLPQLSPDFDLPHLSPEKAPFMNILASSVVEPEEQLSQDDKLLQPFVPPRSVSSIIEPKNHYQRALSGKLVCQLPSSSHINHNQYITDKLERLEEVNTSLGDKWRQFAYRKAVGILKKWPKRIELGDEEALDELSKIRGLGGKMILKIREILETGKLQKLDTLETDEQVQIIEKFSKLHGVGGKTAMQWYRAGYRSLEEVRKANLFNTTQAAAYPFYEDKLKRIPRAEVAAIEAYIQHVANGILKDTTVVCCGSYRRGKPSSGDADVLVTNLLFTNDEAGQERLSQFCKSLIQILRAPIKPPYWYRNGDEGGSMKSIKKEEVRGSNSAAARHQSESSQSSNLELKSKELRGDGQIQVKTEPVNTFVVDAEYALTEIQSDSDYEDLGLETTKVQNTKELLMYDPFISGILSISDNSPSAHVARTFMGFCKLPSNHPMYSGINRRLDIKIYPKPMFPFALLYFTGSDHFNRSMRFYAKKMGYTLSDHGLQKAHRVPGHGKVWKGESADCFTEPHIFEAMGLRYVEPQDRTCYETFDLDSETVKELKQELKNEPEHEPVGTQEPDPLTFS